MAEEKEREQEERPEILGGGKGGAINLGVLALGVFVVAGIVFLIIQLGNRGSGDGGSGDGGASTGSKNPSAPGSSTPGSPSPDYGPDLPEGVPTSLCGGRCYDEALDSISPEELTGLPGDYDGRVMSYLKNLGVTNMAVVGPAEILLQPPTQGLREADLAPIVYYTKSLLPADKTVYLSLVDNEDGTATLKLLSLPATGPQPIGINQVLADRVLFSLYESTFMACPLGC